VAEVERRKQVFRFLQEKTQCLVFWFFLIVILSVSTATAQQRGGGLQGRVLDPAGSAVVGATVKIIAGPGMERNTTTNNEGVYSFNGLMPGKYTVRAAAPGFAAYENKEVNIVANARETLDINVVIEVKEDVTVDPGVNRPSLDPDNNASGVVLRGADLDALSDDPDQLAEDLRSIAGAMGPGGAQFFVDGFSGGRLPPKSSIREVRINQNPFSAEQDTLGFGRIDIFTKPGTDKLHGQAFINFSDESLNARNPFAPERVPYQARQYGGNVTGSFKKKASYFIDVEKRDIDENAVVNALGLDSSLNVVPINLAIVAPQRRTNFSARFDVQLSQNNTLVGRYSVLHNQLDNQGVGGFALPSQGLNTTLTEHTLQLTETAVLSPSLLNETRFQFVHSSQERAGDDSQPALEVRGAFIGGGSRVGLATNDANRYELHNVTNWVRESHNIKFGGRLRFSDIDDSARSIFNGLYVFSSLTQFQQVLSGVPLALPAQFMRGAGTPFSQVDRVDVGGFVQDDWRVHPTFTFSYGLRFETQTNVQDNVDFAPRIAFAWAPGASAKASRPTTVIRGGIGLFYLRFAEDLTLQSERFDGLTQQQVIVDRPIFFPLVPPVESLTSTAPQTIWRVADDYNSPSIVDMALSLEQQLPLRTTLGVTYIHQIDRHLVRSRAINAPIPGTFIPGLPASGVRPFGDDANIFQLESSGIASGDVLLFNIRSQMHRRFSVFSLIRLYREKSNAEGPYDFPSNSYDISNDYARSINSLGPSAFIGSNIVLPWGITLNPLIRAASGPRFNIIIGRDLNGDTVFTERPAFATDLSKPGVLVTPYGAFDPNPTAGQLIIPRNFGKGPATFFINLRVGKTIGFGGNGNGSASSGAGTPQIVLIGPDGQRISRPGMPSAAPGGKPYSLAFSMAIQNLFNRTNFGPIIGNLSSPLFGQANSVSANARRIDFQVRFSF
jgi:hypothetical protein